MELRVKVVSGKNKEKQRVKEIYMKSFQKEDRMNFLLMQLMAKMKNTEFLAFYDEDILCGFVYMATIEKLTFIMFLAVDEKIRSKGYGSLILKKILSIHPDHKIILSIERCDEDVEDKEKRLKRKKIYMKNGYLETGCLVELGNKTQEVLIKNGEFDQDEFVQFFQKYSNGTMRPKVWKIKP